MVVFQELSNSEHAVVELVKKYLHEYGRRWFTYDDIKVYASKTHFYKVYGITDRTIDRTLRGLARAGYFKRITKVIKDIDGKHRRITLFIPTEDFHLYKVIW